MTYDFLKLYLVNKAVDSATALKNTILERYLTQDFVKQMWIAKHMKGEYDRYASGSVPLTLNDSVGKDLVSWSMVGNTVQNGTPSPENPIDVNGVGDWDDTEQKYKIPVVTMGKNLVTLSQDYSWYSTYDRVVSHTNEGIETSGASLAIFPIQLKPNTSYVFTVGEEQSGQTIQWRIYYGDSSVPMGISISSLTEVGLTSKQIFNNITFKTGNSKYFYFGYYCGTKFKATHLQIEENSTATTYEPYTEPTTTNIYLNSPLMSGETMSSDGTITRASGETETFTPTSIPTKSGTTVIDTDCVVAPSSVTAQYKSSKPDNTLTAMMNILSEV